MTTRIYLDFEGYSNGTLVLAGISFGDEVQQIVLHPELKPMAEAEGLEYCEVGRFITGLVEELNSKQAELVAYSTGEQETLKEKCKELGLNLGATIRYHNIKQSSDAWINKFHKQRFDALRPFRKRKRHQDQRRIKNSLASVMRLVGFEAPSDYAPGKTTKRITMVRDGLRAKKGIYEDLTRQKKGDATRLLKHNEYDVAALPRLYQAIERECPDCLKKGRSTFEV